MIVRSWYGSARFKTTSGFSRSIREMSSSVLSASTCAVVIFVLPPASFSFNASHFAFVRLAMQISSKASLFWQHLCTATLATPPAPMIKAFPMIFLLSSTQGRSPPASNHLCSANRRLFPSEKHLS